jgi:hypothetical protein
MNWLVTDIIPQCCNGFLHPIGQFRKFGVANLVYVLQLPNHFFEFRRGSQVVRPGSAKPLLAGSIPARASIYMVDVIVNLNSFMH